MDRTWLAAGALLLALGACAKEQPKEAAAPPGPAKGTKEWKLQDAMSAAPAAIANAATIMDWPTAPNGPMATLRAGANGWTCIPDDPNTPANDPVCGDSTSFAWYGSWMAKKAPHINAMALAFMLQGSSDPSNTDAFTMKPDSGQEWVITGPHIMIFVPDTRAFRGMSTDWKSGGPYVMFANTPYAHLMVPVAPAKHGGMSGM
jgi:hypothetical protein